MGFQVDSHPHAGLGQKTLGAAMEFYTYVNIFETKGLEYLLLLSFLALFILLVRYLSDPGRKNAAPAEKRSTTADQGRWSSVEAVKRKPG